MILLVYSSATLHTPQEVAPTANWNDSTLLEGNVAEEVTKLKRQPGKDIGISGSFTLVRPLLQEGLLDEPRLMVHPVVVGSGKRRFEEGVIGRRWSLSTPRCSAPVSSTSPTGRRTAETISGWGAH
jgi:dihydrofolate reductase